MYYLPSNCFICFKNDNSPPIELRSKVKNRKVEQITYVLPELVEFYSKINICSECYATLQSFYIFKKKCLKNCTYIKNYVATLQKSKSNEKQKDGDLQISINKNELITRLEQDKSVELNDVHIKEEVVEQPVFVSCGTEMHEAEHDNDMVWKVKEEPTFDEYEEQMNTEECLLKPEPEVNIVDTNEDNEIEDISSSAEDNTNFHEDANKDNSKATELSWATEENIDTDDDNELLPQKSRTKYKKEYYKFCGWCKENNNENITENVVLAYFKHMSETKRASTMWSSFSMLRICLSIYKDIDISKFLKVSAFLKRNSKNYLPKKSNVLNSEDIIKFINTAHNDTFLAMKVLLIMGYCGACKRFELTNMKVNDVEIKPEIITVTVPKSKTNLSRMFVVTEASWIALIKHYVDLRPPNITHNRFFLTYRRGRCLPSPIGINKIGVVPKDIARFLKLPNPKLYTGHCFRRSSAAHAKSQLGDMLTIKIHGGAAEGHIVSSIRKRLEIAQMFSNLSQDLSYASVSSQKPKQNCDSKDHIVQENTIGSNKDRRGVHNEIILSKFDQKLPGISITESSI